MENTQNSLKRKERDEISLENIFREIKSSWPHLANIKIHKIMKTILQFGLQQYISKDDYQGLRCVAKLLIEKNNIPSVNKLLEIDIDEDALKHGKDFITKLPNSQMTKFLLSSALAGFDITKFLLKNGASSCVDVDSKVGGTTFLQQAIFLKDIEFIELLINHGANIHMKGKKERPLILAVERNLPEVVELLINNGANINTQSNNGKTPLHICLEKGYLEMAKSLISKGVRLDSVDAVGVTALQLAVQNNNREIVHLLIKEKVNPSPKNRDGFTPLHYASRKGYKEVARMLLEAGAKTEVRNLYGMYPIHLAVFSEKIEMVEMLIKHGANVNQVAFPSLSTFCNYSNYTPLNLAVKKGLEDIVKLLIKNGADLEIPNYQKLTPLLTGITWGRTVICRILTSSGAKTEKVNETLKKILQLDLQEFISQEYDFKGLKSIAEVLIDQSNIFEISDLLELAIDKDGTEAVEIILNHGIDIDAKLPESQMTPIQLSLTKGLSQITRLLIKNGASVDTKDINGQTLLQQAIIRIDIELIELLINHGANVHTKGKNERPLILALENGLPEVAELLIKNGANINTQSIYGKTPLHICLEKGYIELAKSLITKRANYNLDSIDNDWITPLHLAVDNGFQEIVKLLIERKVNSSPETRDRITPLHYASLKGLSDIVKMLLKAGAKTEIQNCHGMFPIHLAILSENMDVVKLLIEHGAKINHIVVPIPSASTDYLHQTPLNIAAMKGLEDIVNILIKNGADLEIPDDKKHTPLLKAILWRKTGVLKLLISNGANVNVTYGEPGQYISPLHISVHNEFVEISKILLLNGANVNAKLTKDIGYTTPLYYAMKKSNVEICMMLICDGADVNAKDSDGLTLLHIAVNIARKASKHPDVLKTLKIIQLLIRSGACLNRQNIDGQSPEEIALAKKKIEMVKFINWSKSHSF